jgi:hypothetical protein
MGVERYRVMVSAVVEVDDPDALLSLARQRFASGAPSEDVDLFLPDSAAALEHVLDPAALTTTSRAWPSCAARWLLRHCNPRTSSGRDVGSAVISRPV